MGRPFRYPVRTASVFSGLGRAENHLWLPLQVVEDDETQARLGDARTETERLQRAVTAFAKFLGQDRGDYMVSDLLREPPAPAVHVPEQAAVREHELAREASEDALRRAHAATAVSPGLARQAQEEAQRAVAEGHCLHAGCRHHVAAAGAVLRSFALRTSSIELTAFVRAALVIELGDERPVDLLLKDAEALAGPVRRADPQAGEDQEEAG